MRWFALPLLLVAACSNERPPKTIARTIPYVAPQTRVEHQPVTGGEVLVMDIANKTPNMALDSIQRCYVWRDEQFKSATMHCAADNTIDLGLPPP